MCNLGIAMDELMRHQPTLKSSVIAALIEVCWMNSYLYMQCVAKYAV